MNRQVPATTWPVEIEIHEPDAEQTCSRATARLRTHDKALLEGRGEAGCHSRNADIVQVSRQMAAARALTDLAHQLFELAAAQDAAAGGHGREFGASEAGRGL
ncbi:MULTISPECIES: dsRBD fold-containing protein [unclassified Rhodococcus (in: high G+C Gram-positive bacteria)]|uniref:dsRBD fold-containing protein n=1 Tax=unclassified Rhodococcus (in: high G+C Gram-positive bacteria) TaxID=192944 RepID=UPI001E5EAB76|nr:dsRBD fold-containing protein [Rhodococcus sp. LB1]